MARVPQRSDNFPLPVRLTAWGATAATLAWLSGFGLIGILLIVAFVTGTGYALRNRGI